MENIPKHEKLKRIPAVGKILSSPQLAEISKPYPRNLTLRAVHRVLEALRKRVESDESVQDPSLFEMERILNDVKTDLRRLASSKLRPLINATGIVIHTNLGRAPLPEEALENIVNVSRGYSNLEYNLERGKRGLRYDHITDVLRELTGAEDALVVNNNA
ncbi:MAG: L-seryl-tRNA(Sec) selenium transferase, partial [Deltaproteobacteria bacterium HGW-Deltaproteobacteria-21]